MQELLHCITAKEELIGTGSSDLIVTKPGELTSADNDISLRLHSIGSEGRVGVKGQPTVSASPPDC